MRSRFLASPAIVVALLLAAGTATASAQAGQSVGQAALSGQLAQSLAGSAQSNASNVTLPVSILSPGSNGSVSQSNNSNANSDATNNNGTTQTADQTQASGGAGLGAIQAAGQAALGGQTAVSGAESSQQNPTNIAVPIRILSPGDNGSVSQSNNSNANSDATNNNGTTQTADQTQAGRAGGALQTVGQLSRNAQGAGSVARSNQIDPTNRAVSIRILSPGDNGSVSQSNNSNANSNATNNNGTTQTADQTQAGGGDGLGAIQAAGQEALNGQAAVSGAESSQQSPSNIAVPIRILSPGDNGSVSQSNNSNANSNATNNNGATQTVTQDPATLLGTFGVSPIQAAGQLAGNRQGAVSEAISRQLDPTNVGLPIRIFSFGENGQVRQSNNSSANSDATNNNDATQSVMEALDTGLLRV